MKIKDDYIISDKKIITDYSPADGNENYHNTELLLKLYRKVNFRNIHIIYSINRIYEDEYGVDVNNFLNDVYSTGIEPGDNANIENNVHRLEYFNKILSIIDTTLEWLKESNANGEYYWAVLYFTYITKHRKSNKQIRKEVSEYVNFKDGMAVMSERTYLRYLKEAIKQLDVVLWSCTSDKEQLTSFIDKYANCMMDFIID